MHGIMEGPGEELTVAAVAAEGLDDDHHHHHHHNGVSLGASPTPLSNGAATHAAKGVVQATSPKAPLSPEVGGQPVPSPDIAAVPKAESDAPEDASMAQPASVPGTEAAAEPPSETPATETSCKAEAKDVSKDIPMEVSTSSTPSAVVEVKAEVQPAVTAVAAGDSLPALPEVPEVPEIPAVPEVASKDSSPNIASAPQLSPKSDIANAGEKANEDVENNAKEIEGDRSVEEDKKCDPLSPPSVPEKPLPQDTENPLDSVPEENTLSSELSANFVLKKTDGAINSICAETADDTVKASCDDIINDSSEGSKVESSAEVKGEKDNEGGMPVVVLSTTGEQDVEMGEGEGTPIVEEVPTPVVEAARVADAIPPSESKVEQTEEKARSVDETSVSPDVPVIVKTEASPEPEKQPCEEDSFQQPRIIVAQKRNSTEDRDNAQAKKKCHIDRSDSSALDLSSMKKSVVPSKEPKIALKPQSLLLSKLQGCVEKLRKDTYSNSEVSHRSNESSRTSKTTPHPRSERRRPSQEERERNQARRRSGDTSTVLRTAERDQVLREMRDRVLSSYKERERASKEESLLRDLLEPEREAMMTDIVENATQNGGISELDRVSHLLEAELRQLTVEISAKEAEWNNLIRKRKLKEELCTRIQRRKQVLVLTADCDKEIGRRSYDEEHRLETKRESRLEARLEGRHETHREMAPKTGEELLATALRLGSRSVEEYLHQRSSGSSPLAVRIQARANELLAGTPIERRSSGPPPGLSQMQPQPQSLLQSQLSKPAEYSPSSSQSQFLLQHLQRQRVLMGAGVGAVSNAGSACRLSPSVSLSAIPSTTTTTPALNASLPVSSIATHKQNTSRADKQQCSAGGQRIQRPILPKPSSATSGGHVVSDASLDANGGGIIGEGRQGPILDVKSIIADYRSKHPEGVPRRGRRLKPSGMASASDNIMTSAGARPGSSSGGGLLSMSLPALGSGAHVRTGGVPVDLSELGFVLTSGAGSDGPSRPSSTESSLSGAASQVNQDANSAAAMSFKDVLVQFAKMTNVNEQNALNNASNLLGRPPPPPYPEVTLHPVMAPMPVPSPAPVVSTPTTSLLHGILTKSNNQSSNGTNQSHAKPTTFSPTLARLLTAPERTSTSSMVNSNANPVVQSYQSLQQSPNYPATGPVLLSDLLSGAASKKGRTELTITPVTPSSAISAQNQMAIGRTKQEVVVLDGDVSDMNGDDGDTDSDDRRLVIDEGDNGENAENIESERNGNALDRSRNSVPHCQGCNDRDAEFVCAGCQRQWYCSRECQIAAWDEHSEQCFPPGPSDA